MASKPRKSYSDPSVDDATLEVEESLKRAYKDVIAYVKDELARMPRDGDTIERTRENLGRITAMVNSIQTRARELGFGDVLQKQAEKLADLVKSIEDEGGKLKVPGQVDDFLVEQLVLGAYRNVVQEELRVAQTIEQILIHDSMGIPYGKLIDKMQGQLELTETQAVTKVTSTIADFHTQNRGEYFKSGGIEWFLYSGPDDDRTREFCSHFVGRRVTLEQLDAASDMYNRKYPLRASIGRGGYNCRHELVPILPENIDDYPEADE